MSIESYLRAMPKAELDIQLEGAIPRKTLLMIADQNEIGASTKGFKKQVESLNTPDYARLTDLIATITQWLHHTDDLSRVVYDVGVGLSKQGVRYAEIGFNPALYSHMGLSFEALIEALNDGVDRVRRGWKVEIAWILSIPRDEPRRADEFVRWAMSATGRKANVVAVGLVGSENAQPAGQFERAFRTAEKKGLPRVVQAGDNLGAEGILDAVNELKPDRIVGGWGTAESPDAVTALIEGGIPLNIAITKALRHRLIENYADYPLRKLIDDGVDLTLTSDLPELYSTTLSDEYITVVEQCGLTIEEAEMLSLNSLKHSFMDETERDSLTKEFKTTFETLRAEHIEPASADAE